RGGRGRDHGERGPAPRAAPARAGVRGRGPVTQRPGLWRRAFRRVPRRALYVTTARFMNRRRGRPPVEPRLNLAGFRALPAPTPRDFAELLAYRSNRDRAWLTEPVLRAAGLPVAREPYRTVEGAGVNLFV